VKSSAIPAKNTIGTSESAKMIATLPLRFPMNRLAKRKTRLSMTPLFVYRALIEADFRSPVLPKPCAKSENLNPFLNSGA
jgi:hypothetical protein